MPELAEAMLEKATAKNSRFNTSLFGIDWIVRTARVFRAAEYADKNMTVTEADLAGAVAAFEKPAPIDDEHNDSAFKLGCLDRIWAKGAELWGRVRIPRPAWELMEQSGVKGVSIECDRSPFRIRKLAITRTPRVADAMIFSADEQAFAVYIPFSEFSIVATREDVIGLKIGLITGALNDRRWRAEDAADPQPYDDEDVQIIDSIIALLGVASTMPSDSEGGTAMSETKPDAGKPEEPTTAELSAKFDDLSAQLKAEREEKVALMTKIRGREIDEAIESLKRDGYLKAAAEPFVRQMIEQHAAQTVTFSRTEGDKAVAETVEFAGAIAWILKANGKVVNYREIAPGGKSEEGGGSNGSETFSDDSVALNDLAEKYAKEKGIGFDAALAAMAEKHPELAEPPVGYG